VQNIEIKEGQNRLKIECREHSYLRVTDERGRVVAHMRGANPMATLLLKSGTYQVETDGQVVSAAADTIEGPIRRTPLAPDDAGTGGKSPGDPAGRPGQVRILLSAPAAELHPVDGIPVLPADGKSALEITLQKVDEAGKALKRKADSDEVYLRCTGGLLQDADGNPLKGAVALSAGSARVRLVSEPYRRVVTLQVLSKAVAGASLTVEFA
jgi:hypothetical protein